MEGLLNQFGDAMIGDHQKPDVPADPVKVARGGCGGRGIAGLEATEVDDGNLVSHHVSPILGRSKFQLALENAASAGFLAMEIRVRWRVSLNFRNAYNFGRFFR